MKSNILKLTLVMVCTYGIGIKASQADYGDVVSMVAEFQFEPMMRDYEYGQAEELIQAGDVDKYKDLAKLFRNHYQNVGLTCRMLQNWHKDHARYVDQTIESTGFYYQILVMARIVVNNWQQEHAPRLNTLLEKLYRQTRTECSAIRADSHYCGLSAQAQKIGNQDLVQVFKNFADVRLQIIAEYEKRSAAKNI